MAEPIVAGLAGAACLMAVARMGLDIRIPDRGASVDALVSLLTANMGLHVTRRVFGEGWRAFPVFAALGVTVALVQFAVLRVLFSPAAAPSVQALLYGPISFVGAPFNLNPPSQIAPIRELLSAAAPNPEAAATAQMAIGVVAAAVLPGLLGRRLMRDIEPDPSRTSSIRHRPAANVWSFGREQTVLLVGILAIVSAAFGAQRLLLFAVPALTQDVLPVILLAYLLGVGARLALDAVRPGTFPEQALTVLLFGPTLSLVPTYAVLAFPLARITATSGPAVAAALAAVAVSTGVAFAAFHVFKRVAHPYTAAFLSLALLAVTTGWGPMAMAYLHQIADEEGPVEPMPVVLPVNAFYLFPWMMIGFAWIVAGPG